MGSVFAGLMRYFSPGFNLMGYIFGDFGIWGCDFGHKMLDGVHI